MLERLAARGRRLAEARAAERRAEIAQAVGEAAPAGVRAAVEDEAVVLSGRGLGRRIVAEAELRWLVRERLR